MSRAPTAHLLTGALDLTPRARANLYPAKSPEMDDMSKTDLAKLTSDDASEPAYRRYSLVSGSAALQQRTTKERYLIWLQVRSRQTDPALPRIAVVQNRSRVSGSRTAKDLGSPNRSRVSESRKECSRVDPFAEGSVESPLRNLLLILT